MHLRPVDPDDLETLFEQQRDAEAHRMAAFTSREPDDRDGYLGWWGRVLRMDGVIARIIEHDGAIAGSILSWTTDDGPEVSYWLGRAWWGRGLATQALKAFAGEVTARPLNARAASDNHGSCRVLDKCGFARIGVERGFAHARGAEIEETIFRLD